MATALGLDTNGDHSATSSTDVDPSKIIMFGALADIPTLSLGAIETAAAARHHALIFGASLDKAFRKFGFVHLTDIPLRLDHDIIFGLCYEFFEMTMKEKMKLTKNSFVKTNTNTYRGYTPPQNAAGGLREVFELGSPYDKGPSSQRPEQEINFNEPSVFPDSHRKLMNDCEFLHCELQVLATKILKLLSLALPPDRPSSFFNPYIKESLSTLRLLHYPPRSGKQPKELVGTAHRDTGLLTILYQDEGCSVEVRSSDGKWIEAPYVEGSVLVNVGDLLAKISGGRWISAVHRVKLVRRDGVADEEWMGMYSVPFSFEPGLECVMRTLKGEEIVYGDYLLNNTNGWVEFKNMVGQVKLSEASRVDAGDDGNAKAEDT